MVVGMIKSLHACAMITQVNTTLLYLSSFKSVKYLCTLNCYTARKNTNQTISYTNSTRTILQMENTCTFKFVCCNYTHYNFKALLNK